MSEDPLAPALLVNELGFGQDFEMMADGGLGKAQGTLQVAAAYLT